MYIATSIVRTCSLTDVYTLFTFQSIKRVVDRRTVDLYAMFSEELNMVKKEFSKQSPALPSSQPKFAGMATWVRALKRRVDLPMKVRLS